MAPNSNYYFQKQKTLTHFPGIWRWLFPSFRRRCNPHWPLQSENLPFRSEVGCFHTLKAKQLWSSQKQGNPLVSHLLELKNWIFTLHIKNSLATSNLLISTAVDLFALQEKPDLESISMQSRHQCQPDKGYKLPFT